MTDNSYYRGIRAVLDKILSLDGFKYFSANDDYDKQRHYGVGILTMALHTALDGDEIKYISANHTQTELENQRPIITGEITVLGETGIYSVSVDEYPYSAKPIEVKWLSYSNLASLRVSDGHVWWHDARNERGTALTLVFKDGSESVLKLAQFPAPGAGDELRALIPFLKKAMA